MPPEILRDKEPLLPPLQLTGVGVSAAVMGGPCVMVVEAAAEQPLAAVTVMLYEPAAKLAGLLPLSDAGLHV